jgi:hypothetical protein
MTNAAGKRSWRCAALAGALGVAMAIGLAGSDARAEDDEDAAFDTKILRHILSGLGLRRDGAGIDYRERPPLVLPPSRELPPPEQTQAKKETGWPDDPDVRQARAMKEARRKRKPHVEGVDDRPLLPSQYSSPAPPAPDDGRPQKTADESARPSTRTELGSKSFFNLKSLWGSKEEYATFAGEPPRATLIEPPAGYRTPSPNQPYGVGKEKWTPRPTERHVLQQQ